MFAKTRLAQAGLWLSLWCCLGAAKPALPEADPDFAVTAANQSVLIDVLANDASVGANRRLLKAFKPGHGTATLESGRVRYKPAAGYSGSDQFQYLVQAGEAQPRVGNVNVEVGSSGVLLTIHGQVVDDPIPNAVVHVTVGGFTFVAVANPAGVYELQVAALAGAGMVTLRAVGTSETGAPVEFVSMLGQLAALDAQAGGDNDLTLDENSGVNVTHVSTALYVLAVEANGGVAPTNQVEFQQAVQHIDVTELSELAAVIKLVVDGGQEMPAGTTSVLDLISDPTALALFEDGLPEGALEAAIDEVSDDTALLSGYSAGRVPSGYAIIFPGAPGTIRVGLNGQSLLALDGAASGATSGTGTWISALPATDPGVTWSLDGTDLVIAVSEPRNYLRHDRIPGCADPLATMVSTGGSTQFRVQRLQDGATGVDFLRVDETYTGTSIADDDPDDACVPPATPQVFVDEFVALGYKDGAGELPYTAGELLGTQMLVDYRSIPSGGGNPSPWGASLFDFDTGSAPAGCGLAHGGTVTRNTSRLGNDHPTTSWPTDFSVANNFCWANVGGHLLVRATDPDDGVVREFTYRRYQSDTRKGEGVMAVVEPCQLDGGGAVVGCSGPQAVTFNLAARADGSTFTTANLPGEWRSGFDISIFQPDLATKTGFFYLVYPQPDAAHQSAQKSVTYDTNGNPVTVVNLNYLWAIEDGRWEARAYRQAGVPCYTPSATCTMNRRREWTLVARDGDRIYVLERLYQRFLGAPELVSERPNFWDVGPLP
jgi:hypothetical protein